MAETKEKLYYMFHKPSGCITARKDAVHKTVMEYFPKELAEELHPVGRLDKDTQGLLLLTNDGEWNQKLMHPRHHVEKTYFFWALGYLDSLKKEKLEHGVELRGEEEPSAPAKLEILQSAKVEDIAYLFQKNKISNVVHNLQNQDVISGYLTISQGKKHQVKRMLKAVGCYVVYLKRVSIGNLQLDDTLKCGDYRKLTKEEIIILERSEHYEDNYHKRDL